MERIKALCRRFPWRLAAAAILIALGAYIDLFRMGYTVSACFLCALGAVLIAAWLLRRKKTALRILRGATALALAALIAGAIPPILTAQKGDGDAAAPYLIVLGAQVRGETPSASLAERLTAAREYLIAHPETEAILSGGKGNGENLSEAEAMARWLTARGIGADRLIREERSASTRENLTYSFEMLKEMGYDPARGVAILSSEYHLYRACRMAEKLGAAPVGVAAHTGFWGLRWNYYLRESLAVWYMWVFG